MGTKRRNFSLRSNGDDSSSQSTFSGQIVAPSLDRRRLARQHVRALNTEFASWVQCQLQDHPDELWEDGAGEYLSHASDILEKFTDVINWLKADRGREGNAPNLGTRSTESNNLPEAIAKEPKTFPTVMFGKPSTSAGETTSINGGSASVKTSALGATASSAPSWSFGLSAANQSLSQSSSAGLAMSWSSGVFSNTKSPSPVKSVSETTPLTATISFAASSHSGLFSSSQPASFGTTPSFTAPWSAGAFSNNQTTFKFGNQSSELSNNCNDNAKDNADDDNEPEQPSSPSLKKSEEKGIIVVHETKCKLYIKSTDPDDKEPWKDKGTGQLFIKCEEGASKGSKESKPRILVRNDVGRIMLNASLYPGIKTNLQKNAIVTIFHVSDDNGDNAKAVARTFLIRTKNEEERNKLADTIRDHAPAA